MSDFIPVAPNAAVTGAGVEYPLIGLQVGKEKFQVPNFNDSRFPADLIPAMLMIKANPKRTVEQDTQITAGFIAYFQAEHPRVWAEIRKQGNALAWVAGILEAWAKASAIDPKA